MKFSKSDLLPDISFKTSRSGGKGGQHVNKVSTKVELLYDIDKAAIFSDVEKERIKEKLQGRLSAGGSIQVIADEQRSQLLNKEVCMDKLLALLQTALFVEKPRKATKPGKAAKERRLKSKRLQALKKINRQRFDD